MKVVRITLRTPGIFLSVGHAETAPNLTLHVRKISPEQDSDWKSVNDVADIQVLSGSIEIPSVLETLQTGSVEVPRQDDSIRTFDLLMQDQETWEYRISAQPCLDCERIFTSRGEEARIWEHGVIVGSGSIQS